MKRLRAGIAKVTVAAGVGTATWLDPETALTPTTETIQLDWAPIWVWMVPVTNGGAPGNAIIAPGNATANGVTITNSNLADTSSYYVYALCKIADVGIF